MSENEINKSSNNKSKQLVKSPNPIIYFLFFILLKPLVKIMFRLKVDRSALTEINEPFVVLCNHASFMDFITTMLTMYPKRLNAVVAQKYFYYSPLNRFLPFVGCIPKNLFDPDPRAVMGIISVIRQGGNILLFPEGRCTTSGGYMGMHKATGKLIKKLNVPVVTCYIEGAYNCMPFWRKGLRLGKQRVTVKTLLSTQDIASLTVDEINAHIDDALSGLSAFPDDNSLRVKHERNLTSGLENILYYCPKCHEEFTQRTYDNSIKCGACGNIALMDAYGKLFSGRADSIVPKNVHEWYLLQSQIEASRLDENRDFFSIDCDVRMHLHQAKGLEVCGHGVVSLNKYGWNYDGILLGENVYLHFPIDTVPAIPIDAGDNFQIYSKGTIYTFSPRVSPRVCVQCSVIGEAAYWKFASSVAMTPAK